MKTSGAVRAIRAFWGAVAARAKGTGHFDGIQTSQLSAFVHIAGARWPKAYLASLPRDKPQLQPAPSARGRCTPSSQARRKLPSGAVCNPLLDLWDRRVPIGPRDDPSVPLVRLVAGSASASAQGEILPEWPRTAPDTTARAPAC